MKGDGIMFVVAFNSEDYDKLLLKGYKFICENNIGDKKCYIFEDNELITFSKEDNMHVIKTNKLYF